MNYLDSNILTVAFKSVKKSNIFIIILITILFSLVSLMFPLLTKNIIQDLENQKLEISSVTFLVSFLILKTVLEAIYTYSLSKLGAKIIQTSRISIYNQIMSYNTGFFDKNHSGKLSSRIINDTEIIKDLITEDIPEVINGTIMIVGTIVIMTWLDWKLTTIILIVIPIIFIFIFPLLKKLDGLGEIQQVEKASFISRTQEIFKNIKTIKSHNAELYEKNTVTNNINNLYNATLKENKILSVISPLLNLLLISGIIIIGIYGIYRVSNESLAFGTLVAFIIYILQIINPITSIGTFWGQYQKAIGSLKNLNQIIDKKNIEHIGYQDFSFNEKIKFNNVSLRINQKNILKNLSFEIKKGQHLTIVGPSGAGKSSIINLLEKFYVPTEGNIYIDNINYGNIKINDLRKKIGLVSQNTSIFNDSVFNNIIYGNEKKDISMQKLEDAIKNARLDSFFNKYDYNSIIGEDGKTISGGEKQRFNIARLFLKNPEIILLDEPTVSLDNKSKGKIESSLEKLTEDKTSIKITHNLEEIEDNDYILFISQGELIGKGMHLELMEENIEYKKFILKNNKELDLYGTKKSSFKITRS